MSLKFSRSRRLLNRSDFRAIYREGRKFIGKRLVLFYSTPLSSRTRLGITITKKWGKAHDRNRFKRVSREGFRRRYPLLPQGLDIDIRPREGYRDLTPEAVAVELENFTLHIEKIQRRIER
ncbi:MAG: ribonuclease P protein component [Chlamydiota bacterium]